MTINQTNELFSTVCQHQMKDNVVYSRTDTLNSNELFSTLQVLNTTPTLTKEQHSSLLKNFTFTKPKSKLFFDNGDNSQPLSGFLSTHQITSYKGR